MAKISEYGNYDTDKSQAEVEKFQETGVLPVSGKYADNGNMTTKNVKLSDLVGGGGAPVPTPAGGDVGKVLTVGDSDNLVWDTVPSSPTNVIGGSDGAIYGSGAYCYVQTDEHTIKVNNQNKLEADFSIIDGSGSVIDVQHGDGIHIGFDTTGATVGDVLTVDQYGAHWAAPGGGAPVPTPTSADVGKVLTVDSSDNIVWDAVPSTQPIYGEGLEYDSNTNTLKFNYLGSGGLTSERTLSDKYAMKVKAGNGIKVDNVGVSIDTDTAEDGQILSYDDTTKKVKWVDSEGGGGGGGGNPYTKATVTPGDCYFNGKISDSDFPLYDQDVTISNNTYSVLPSPIGWYPDWTDEHGDWHPAHNLDNLVIKLPSNTEFPMAVVEFTIQDNDNYSYWGCVNNVKVKVGETELTRMYSAPYNPNTLLLGGDYHDQFEYWKLVTVPNEGNPYYRIEEIHNEYRGADISAFVHGTKVQVHIFGSCFNITVSQACGEPAAS